MKYIMSIILIVTHVIAQDYYAKIEPIEIYNIKSAVSGKVIFVNNNFESKIVKDNLLIKIDDKVNKIELLQTKNKLLNMKGVLKIHTETLKSFNKVSSKSKFDKDNQRIVILNTKTTINDLKIRIETLKNNINNKNIKISNLYVHNIYVSKDDYVNPGTLLIKAYDLSKGKLEIFVRNDELKNINTKTIIIDGKITNLKISKIFKITDSKHLSSYKVEIIIPEVKQFSKLVKITFK